MNDLVFMDKSVDRKISAKMKQFCTPLVDTFGLSQFYYYRLQNDGQYVSANLHSEWSAKFYHEDHHKRWPFFRHPDLMSGGVCILQPIDDKQYDFVLKEAREKYNLNYSFQLNYKTESGVEAYGFALDSNNLNKQLLFAQHIPLLRVFIKSFREQLLPSFNILKDNEVDIGKILGKSFYQQPIIQPLKPTESLLEQFGIYLSNPLSEREQDVAKELLKGFSASQIGETLFISKRTVEHHIDRMKEKLDASTKSALIQKLRTLESIGYIIP